ncbi:hypothetical protein EV426DRAFT_643630 [Tirmania nivea]|nr:hypothetical protein EV426DRAFT_643630 [Tirmania nivea]
MAMFLLEHVVRLVEGVGLGEAPPVFEERDELSEKITSIIGEREGLQSEVDDLGDKVGELLQELSRKSESEEVYSEKVRELSKIEKEYENVMKAAVEENMGLKKQLWDAELAKAEAEIKWKQWAEREVQGKCEEVETGAEEGIKKEREQQLEKEIQVRAEKLVVVERKKWQAKGKARSIETMSVGTQVGHFLEERRLQVEVVVQTEEEVMAQTGRQNEEGGGGTRLDVIVEDAIIKNSLDLYDDLSRYEDEGVEERLVEGRVASPVTSRQKATKRPQVAKNKKTSYPLPSGGKVSTSAFVVHGIPTARPMSESVQDVKKVGVSGVIGARWLLGENRRVGKLTSSLVIFLDPKAKVTFDQAGSWITIRGRKLPAEVYDFDRGRSTGARER